MRGNFISGMVDLVHQQEIRQKKHRLDRETKKSEIKYNVMEIGKESGQRGLAIASIALSSVDVVDINTMQLLQQSAALRPSHMGATED